MGRGVDRRRGYQQLARARQMGRLHFSRIIHPGQGGGAGQRVRGYRSAYDRTRRQSRLWAFVTGFGVQPGRASNYRRDIEQLRLRLRGGFVARQIAGMRPGLQVRIRIPADREVRAA